MAKKFLRSLLRLQTDAVPVATNSNSVENLNANESNSQYLQNGNNIGNELALRGNDGEQSTDLIPNGTQIQENNTTQNIMAVNNTQGHVVMQISDVKGGVHIGPVYNFSNNSNETKEQVGKDKRNRRTKTIDSMMRSTETLREHRMLDTISTHLGEGWRNVMRELKFTDGQIDQAIINYQIHGGIKEVIYQLLLDWTRNADEEICTLGYISKILWKSEHRQCVYQMKEAWKLCKIQEM